MTAAGRTADERMVLEFLGAWEDADIDHLLSHFTADASFGNGANPDMPVPPRVGHDEIRGYLAALFDARAVRIVTSRIASNDDGDVFTERTDYVRAKDDPDAPWVGLPIAGVMQLRDGKIAVWREYLDTRVLEEGLGITIERQG